MSEPIVYIDTSDVREGKLEQLKASIKELVEFVDSNEPRAILYNVHFSEDGRRMTVVEVFPDSAALEFHMKIAGPAFPKFADLLRLSSIEIYGAPSDALLKRLRQKAEMLGSGTVTVHPLHAGLARFMPG